MGSSRSWNPTSRRESIETVVRCDVLPELCERLARRKRAEAAWARQLAARQAGERALEKARYGGEPDPDALAVTRGDDTGERSPATPDSIFQSAWRY